MSRPQANQQAARAARKTIVKSLEKLHPGMVVFAGPFEIQHSDLVTRDRAQADCLKVKKEFITAQVAVRVVLTRAGAYVLRAKEGLHTANSTALKHYAGKLRDFRRSQKGALRR